MEFRKLCAPRLQGTAHALVHMCMFNLWKTQIAMHSSSTVHLPSLGPFEGWQSRYVFQEDTVVVHFGNSGVAVRSLMNGV